MKVQILLPDKWYRRPRYKLLEAVEVCGYTVPAGFITDGATVPRFLWPVFPTTGRYLSAAVLHDYLLTTKDRRSADLEFNRAMKQLSIKPWRRNIMFTAVRAFSFYREFFPSS